MFAPEVFAQILRELFNNTKYGATYPVHRLFVGLPVKITQKTLNIIREQR